jgi:hypothetical protein
MRDVIQSRVRNPEFKIQRQFEVFKSGSTFWVREARTT